jgi:hypothetical protein
VAFLLENSDGSSGGGVRRAAWSRGSIHAVDALARALL